VRPFEAVEDQAEPELELAAVVIAGLQDVPGGQLGGSTGKEQAPPA
jgi:hypothetical protein